MGQRYVSFLVGENTYAIPLDEVVRIVPYGEVTQVPKALEFVEGVLNLHGEVVPILNMRERFGLPRDDTVQRRRILVVRAGKRSYGFVVDSVREIVEIDEENVERDATAIFGQRAKYTGGIAELKDGLLVILDPVSIVAAT